MGYVCCMSSVHTDESHQHPEITTREQGVVLGLYSARLSVEQQKIPEGMAVGAGCTIFVVPSSVATTVPCEPPWGLAARSRVCLCCGGVLILQENCACVGTPDTALLAGLFVQQARQPVCSSTPAFRVSVERVIYACMNTVEATHRWFWAAPARCSTGSGEGEPGAALSCSACQR